MRFHEKVGLLRSLRPDVAVVPECACPEIVLRRATGVGARSFAWVGENPRKGLAVLSFGPWNAEPRRRDVTGPGTILALEVEGPASFRLLAVWNSPRRRRKEGFRRATLRQVLDAVAPFLSTPPAILAGDLNSALLRRNRQGARAPSRLARSIEAMGLKSAYHARRGVPLGREPEPTLFVHRGLSWRRHVDYCFLDPTGLEALRGVEVGPALPWILASDHAPLVVDVGLEGERGERRPDGISLDGRELAACTPRVQDLRFPLPLSEEEHS